jgi:beta-aspartyl-peptidase (threonine type)
MVGRVGDSPFPGAGNYACARIASSATGTGEFVLRSLATRAIAERVENGLSLEAAMAAVLKRLGEDFDADVGFIAVDDQGLPVAMHRTRDMPHAFFSGEAPIVSRMRAQALG